LDFNEIIESIPVKPYFRDEQADIVIYCADCRDVLKFIPDKSIDLLLTDPSYGINMDSELHKNNGLHGYKDYGDTNWDIKPSRGTFAEIFRVSQNQIIWGGNYFIDYLYPTMGWLVWDKGQRDFTLADGELAWTSFQNALRIYTVPRSIALRDGKQHPTQKSQEIMNFSVLYADRNSNNKIDLIIDPFLGSGTTAYCAKKLGRKCIGIEIEEKYCSIAKQRLSQSVMRL